MKFFIPFKILKAIKHKNFDRKTNPCSDFNNNFADCINEKLMFNVGCQPHWFYKPEINLTLCSNFSQFNTFISEYTEIWDLSPKDINERFGCVKPCTYMEYKVNTHLIDYNS